MTEADSAQKGLLANIRAEPASNDLRLIYADWLEEHDNPALHALGEFIHARMSVASLPANDPQRQGLEQIANELRKKHGPQWEAPVRDCVGVTEIRYDQRGMAQATLPLDVFLEHSDALLASPVLAGVEARLTGLTNQNATARLAMIQALAGYCQLAILTSLNLGDNGLGGDGQGPAVIRALGGCSNLSNLTSLDLGGNRLGDDEQAEAAIQALAGCSNFSNLTSLDLEYNGLGDDEQAEASIQALAGCSNLSNLTSLDLVYNRLGSDGHAEAAIQALAGCSNFSNLTSLNLGYNLLGSDGQGPAVIRALAGCSNLSNLTSLDLVYNRLGSDGHAEASIQALAGCSNFSNLTSLDLAYNLLGSDGQGSAVIRALGQCQQFRSLQVLDLRGNEIETAEEVRPLCDAIRRHVFPAIERVQISEDKDDVAQAAVDEAIRQHRSMQQRSGAIRNR